MYVCEVQTYASFYFAWDRDQTIARCTFFSTYIVARADIEYAFYFDKLIVDVFGIN